MAVNYTTLFTRLGRYAYWMNQFLAYQGTTLLGSNGTFDDINDEYSANPELVSGLYSSVDQMASSAAGWINVLKGYADRTLADLQGELNARSNTPADILAALSLRMVTDTETIKANTIASPSITVGGANVGSGTLVANKQTFKAADDERIIDETVAITCMADRFSGASAGNETFQIIGYPKFNASSYKTRGNGGPVTMNLANSSAANRLLNGSFDAFTSNVPTSWTLDAGTAGTSTLAESSIVQHTGATALKLASNGVITTVTLSQSLATRLQAGRQYAVGVWVRKGGTVSGGSNLAVRITGTGISTVNLFNADPTTLTTSYALVTGYVNLNATVPTDLKIEITWTSANSAGASAVVYLDDAAIAETVRFGHVGYAIFRGATDFLKNDRWSIVTDNNYGGVFQTWLGRFYDVQLPSSGSPSIADSLAT